MIDPNTGKPLLFAANGGNPLNYVSSPDDASPDHVSLKKQIEDKADLDGFLGQLRDDSSKLHDDAAKLTWGDKLANAFGITTGAQQTVNYDQQTTATDLQTVLRYGSIVAAEQSGVRPHPELYSPDYNANIPIDKTSSILEDAKQVGEFVTQFKEGVEGAEHIAGKIGEISQVFQLITGSETAESITKLAERVEKSLKSVSGVANATLAPYRAANTVTSAAQEVNTLATDLVSHDLPASVVDPNLDAGTIDTTYQARDVGGFADMMKTIGNQLDNVMMNAPGVPWIKKIVTPNPSQPPLKNAPDPNNN
jgi:hypothetical protein